MYSSYRLKQTFPAISPIRCLVMLNSPNFRRNSISELPVWSIHIVRHHRHCRSPLAIDGRPNSTTVPDIARSSPAMIQFLSIHQFPAKNVFPRGDHAAKYTRLVSRNGLKWTAENIRIRSKYCSRSDVLNTFNAFSSHMHSIRNSSMQSHKQRKLRSLDSVHMARMNSVCCCWMFIPL